jgi:hypothetical protein
MKLIHVGPGDRARFQQHLAAFDDFISYPLGHDRFRLDHGPDYYAFFDRLGRVSAYVMYEGEQMIGTGMAILRRVPYVSGGKPKKTWYACDAKMHPDHRGRGLGMGAASRHFLSHYLRCGHGYAISMNPGDGRENGVVRHAQRYKRARVHIAGVLNIFSLDADAMARLAPLVVEHRGPLSYLSLQGKKDLILDSTQARLPLLHVQFGPCAEAGLPAPVAGHTHMLCALQTDGLSAALAAAGIEASATATILAHRMDPCDWRFVLTSDI